MTGWGVTPPTGGALVGARVEDSQCQFGEGVVLAHDAVMVRVRWDSMPDAMWHRWNEGVEIISDDA